ncbi:hypothetical protein JRQ81_003449 [Phrynocephalus forsythii]|uniref:Uncharacterized protein n=1 Tax=Phrynocephalus forsythii TaxID=171643 RepID=A0A9Q0XK83_9SAUR|nr:hypothetical protein JRQ81_003449 [Phrynocephalus forsythii]
MWAYTVAPQEGKRLWVLLPAPVLIWGVLIGHWVAEAAAAALNGKAEGPDVCPTIHRYIPRDSRAFIPISHPKGFSVLCRVNASSSRCEWVLLVNRGRSYYFNMDLKNHLTLNNMGLVVRHMSKELEGEYQVLSGHNRTCDGRVLMTAVGPLFLYWIFLIPGILFLAGLVLLWDWLVKARRQLAASAEGENIDGRIQHVIPPAHPSCPNWI